MSKITFEEFSYVHEHQLYRGIGFPKHLIKDLFQKLQLQRCDNEMKETFERRKFSNSRSILIAKKDLEETSCFFLIDHIWTVDSNSAYQQLSKSPKLVEKIAELFDIPPPDDVQSFFKHNNQIDNVKQLKKLQNADLAETIVDNNNGDTINSAICVLDEIDPKDIRSDGNTKEKNSEDCSYEEFKKAMTSTGNIPENASDAYIYKLYENFLKRDQGYGTTLNYNWSDEGDGIITVNVPLPLSANKSNIQSILTSTAWSLVVEGKDILNGSLYANVKKDESFWSIDEPGLLCMSLQKIDIDQTWPVLIKNEELLSPKQILLKSWAKEYIESLYIEEILDEMWKYNLTYCKYEPGKPQEPQWYIMDKYGSSLIHDRDPNFACFPFFYAVNGKAYSILWPRKDVKAGSICTRDFMPKYSFNHKEHEEIYKVYLKAFTWKPVHERVDLKEKEKSENMLKDIKINDLDNLKDVEQKENKLYVKAFSQNDLKKVISKLKDFEVLENPNKTVNQLLSINDALITIDGELCPMQEILESKEFLETYLRFSFGDDADLLMPKSYILPSKLIDFNKDVESSNLPKYWVAKPVEPKKYNIGLFVSSQYSRIARMTEACYLVVSEYMVYQPLFRNRKFALTYNMLITPSKDVYIHKVPFIRLAATELEKNAIPNEHDYSTTITQTPTQNINMQVEWFDEFKITMNKLLLPKDPNKGWNKVEEKIFKKLGLFIKQLGQDLKVKDEKKYFIFSADVILNDDVEPFICDINAQAFLPNEESAKDFVGLVQGIKSSQFVEVQ